MASVGFEMGGFKELSKAFNDLPIKSRDKGLKSAIVAAGNPMVKKLRAFAPEDLGHLKKNFKTKGVLYRRNGTAVGVVGARSRWIQVPKSIRWTKSGSVNPAKYIHLANKVSRRPHFMERAFDASVGASEVRFIRFFKKALEREARKLMK